MRNHCLIFLLCLSAISSSIVAQDIEADIIQLKLNRLYFESGSEQGIYVGSPYRIECGDSTTLEGLIDYVGPGISFSRPVARLDSFALEQDCRAWLSGTKIDSNAIIHLGTDMPLRMFDPIHETLFLREGDSVRAWLVDSSRNIGSTLELYLPADVRFSDGSRLDAGTLLECFSYVKTYGQSYLTRYFFSKLLPLDSGGLELIDGFSLRLHFYHPLPRAEYYLSYPDFALSKTNGLGTGPLLEIASAESGDSQRTFLVNRFHRGNLPAFHKLSITHYRGSFRMRYAFDAGRLDGYFGFGFDDVLAGSYQAMALYPETAVMISGLGGPAFSQGMFATSLYYRFDQNQSHLFFPDGETEAVNRWLIAEDSTDLRYFPNDFTRGGKLQRAISSLPDQVRLVYDDPLLMEATRFLADIAAREGTRASIQAVGADNGFDIKLAFVPVTDRIMPYALLWAVLDLNDQNAAIPPGDRLNRPGWADTDRGSRLREVENRRKFFARAEEVIVEDGGCFPLFRPRVYGVAQTLVKNLAFDDYGFPVLHKITKHRRGASEGKP
ncbi:MAG: hypothetical protein GY841_19255 [FCB group bacterium]|nr:hypothetical protein [FCB group bacterium]